MDYAHTIAMHNVSHLHYSVLSKASVLTPDSLLSTVVIMKYYMNNITAPLPDKLPPSFM